MCIRLGKRMIHQPMLMSAPLQPMHPEKGLLQNIIRMQDFIRYMVLITGYMKCAEFRLVAGITLRKQGKRKGGMEMNIPMPEVIL